MKILLNSNKINVSIYARIYTSLTTQLKKGILCLKLVENFSNMFFNIWIYIAHLVP